MGISAKGCAVRLNSLYITYRARNNVDAVRNLSLEIPEGEFACILGTTGCGKSTILNAIAGFIFPTSGSVDVDGEAVRGPSAKTGVVFQQFALFPWLTVLGNVSFGPKSLGVARGKANRIALDYIDMVGLADFADAYPRELSGGMQQRVGLARALANSPRLLLMDEPFGSLDAQTRVDMQELLLRIWSGSGITVVFVTHDVDEAIFLADRIFVLTARPACLKEIHPVDVERPRSYDIVTTDHYMALKRRILRSIREERVGAQPERDGMSK